MGVDAATPERYEQSELAAVVKWLQRTGACDTQGRSWSDWLQSHKEAKAPAPPLDPRRHNADVLTAFIDAMPSKVRAAARGQLKRARNARRAFAGMQRALGSSAKGDAEIIGLMQHTRAHQRFWENYVTLPSHEDGWVVAPAPLGKAVDKAGGARGLSLIAIDCEMVATVKDGNALARVCVCDGEGKLLLDRLVRPEDEPTDLRTEITGITAQELRAVTYTLQDAQQDVLSLMCPLTVVVGHTLHKDLSALRLDALLVLDIGLLYGLEGLPSRMPPLAHLVEKVLGRTDFRGADGRAAHNCADDVMVTMQICKRRITQCVEDAKVRAVVWVPPPQVAEHIDEKEARALLVHRMPDRSGLLMAVMSLFSSLGGASSQLEGVDMMPLGDRPGQQGLRSARVLFKTKQDAEDAFKQLSGISEGPDSMGRPQKLVSLAAFLDGADAKAYVRLPRAGNAVDGVAAPVAGGADARQVLVPENGVTADWKGWEKAADEELREAGGAMPWQRLRSAMVKRCRASWSTAAALSEEELGRRALASLPESYLSRSSDLVRAVKRRKGAQSE